MKLAVNKDIGQLFEATEMLTHYKMIFDEVDGAYDFDGNNEIDITSFESLNVFFCNERIDYFTFRESLKANVLPVFSGQDDLHIQLCIGHYIFPAGFDCLPYGFDAEKMQQAKNDMFDAHMAARAKRKNKLRLLIGNTMPQYSFQLNYELEVRGMSENKVPILISYVNSLEPDVFYWLMGGSGVGSDGVRSVDYTSTGFPGQSFFDSTFQQKAFKILKYGIY